MNIPELSIALSQVSTQNDLGVLMLSKAMDTSEILGESMVEMLDASAMERSVNPHIGGNIDLQV